MATDVKGALGGSLRDAGEVATELRRDFLRIFQTEFERAPTSDPVLSVLFQALGVQVGRVYQEAENKFPWQVLDDLMAGLGMPRPMASPAQTVVAFKNIDRRERITTELEMVGMSKGESLRFSPDVSIELAPTTLRFAGVAESGRLHVIPGATLPTGLPWPPNAAPCAAAAGNTAMMLLAFTADEAHLSGLGIHFKTSAMGSHVTEAITRSPWVILDENGVHHERSTMRASITRGGVRALEWFDDRSVRLEDEARTEIPDAERVLDVATGPYGEQLFVLPPIPSERRTRGAPPQRFVEALQAIAPDSLPKWFETPLIWLYIPLPAGTKSVVNAVQNVTLNAVTASNIEVFTEEVNFGKTGQVVAMRPEGERNRHIMGILSVIGESGTRYVPESDLTAPESSGTLRVRDERIELRPAKRTGGRFDGYAILRLLLCDGARGNGLEPDAIRRIVTRMSNVTAQVTNITTSRGGAEPPTYSTAKYRFAELLRTRERVVTTPDFEVTARAFDPRVESVEVSSMSEVAGGALQAVDMIKVTVPRSQLADAEADVVRLQSGLERHFEKRAVLGRRVRVSIAVSET